ncbi:Signal peptidase complex subunit 1 [Astathelohania contejeani]|uniref:Signal peptidase complex subunit 1 n=1 Tax=Astathelohania contejeani TaxID=164912 RepID=A0ABQ7HXM7_9MICR|nr:Signal peptidase complex subunit 1 [Thelohania contejeani]
MRFSIINKYVFIIPPMQLLYSIDKPIDYHGQHLAKQLMYSILATGYFIALIFGYVFGNLYHTLCIGIITAIIGCIVVIPPWGFYRKNPVIFKPVIKQKDE